MPPLDPAPDFARRWTAWQAHGAAHERAVRRRLAIFAPITVLGALALFLVIGS